MKQSPAMTMAKLIVLVSVLFVQCHTVQLPVAAAPPLPARRIDSLLQTAVDSGWVAGAVGFVTIDNKVVYNKAFGFADKATQQPMRTDHMFRIASQTKAITSVAIMMLYDEGKVSLTDPVSHFIPAFASVRVLKDFLPADSSYTTIPATREITIRDLLTHTSGIDYAIIGSDKMKAIYAKAGLAPGFGDDTMLLAHMVNKLAEQPLAHQPGEKFTYSLGVDVLGRIVEIASGKPLDSFFYRRIFEPLSMSDTYFYVPSGKQNRVVTVYTTDSAGNIIPWTKPINKIRADYPYLQGSYFAGGAGLSSTVADYAKFLQMMLNEGTYNGHRLLRQSTVQLMTTNRIGELKVGSDKFGLGFAIASAETEKNTGVSEGSFSWGGFFGTIYWADPKRNLVGELFLQQSPLPHNEIQQSFKELVYAH